MSSEELFDNLLPDALNVQPSPSSLFSTPVDYSGVVGEARSVNPVAAVSKDGMGYVCTECNKVLATKSGFTRHSMVHKLNDYDARRPLEDDIRTALPDLFRKVLEDVKNEPAVSDMGFQKRKFIEVFDLDNNHTMDFLSVVTDPILTALTVRSRVTPTAQYENAVGSINALLAKPEFYADVKKILSKPCFQEFSDILWNRMIWRLTSKLTEKIQAKIFHDMKVNHQTAHQSFIMNESDKDAFKIHIGHILRGTYRFGARTQNHVWRLRCESLRKKFVVAAEDVTVDQFLNKKLWSDGEISLSSACLSLFLGLERIIQKFQNSATAFNADDVFNSLTSPENIIILDELRGLSQGILAEDAAIDFLKELIKGLLKVSGDLEAKRKFLKASKKQPSSRVSLRTNLKRDPKKNVVGTKSASKSEQGKNAPPPKKSVKAKKQPSSQEHLKNLEKNPKQIVAATKRVSKSKTGINVPPNKKKADQGKPAKDPLSGAGPSQATMKVKPRAPKKKEAKKLPEKKRAGTESKSSASEAGPSQYVKEPPEKKKKPPSQPIAPPSEVNAPAIRSSARIRSRQKQN